MIFEFFTYMNKRTYTGDTTIPDRVPSWVKPDAVIFATYEISPAMFVRIAIPFVDGALVLWRTAGPIRSIGVTRR